METAFPGDQEKEEEKERSDGGNSNEEGRILHKLQKEHQQHKNHDGAGRSHEAGRKNHEREGRSHEAGKKPLDVVSQHNRSHKHKIRVRDETWLVACSAALLPHLAVSSLGIAVKLVSSSLTLLLLGCFVASFSFTNIPV